MNLIKNFFGLFLNGVKKLFSSRSRLAIFLILVLIIGFVGWKFFSSRSSQPQYQKAQAEKGTLVTSVSASGNITSGSNLPITTNATGIVSHVYVKNGDKVTRGQKIADLILDQDSQQKQTAAWSSYLSAKNSLESAKTALYSLDSQKWAANQKFINDAVARNLATNDPTYIQQNDDWLAAEAKYKNQQTVIAQAQAAVTNAQMAYQQVSSTIIAPMSGVVGNLTIAPGLSIGAQLSSSSSSSNSSSAQELGTITAPDGKIQATVNLSEVDVAKVSSGQKVTLTLDAFSGKTFTGKVLIVNTNGQVSSGVTNYPATIVFDTSADKIYPNMAVNAKVITNVKDNVILVPSAAVQTANGQSTVRILENGQINQVSVEVGGSNDTQIEIVSGLNEGDTVVIGTTGQATGSSQGQGSPFGSFGGGGVFRGGGH